jgi:heme A synthase
MDADDLRVVSDLDFVVIIEAISRLGAVAFLFLIVFLLLRARRRSKGDIWIGLVFGSWMLAIAYSAVRYVLGYPPMVLPPLYYIAVFVLEIVASYHMITESNRTMELRRQRDKWRDTGEGR